MVYFSIGLILSLFALRENRTGRSNTKVFNILCAVLTIMICFRFGQGTDYFAYSYQYSSINTSITWKINQLYHGEWGWYLLLFLARWLGLSWEVYIGLFSFFLMYLITKSIYKYSVFLCTGLLILFPTYYLVYCFSGIRQAFSLALFLGIGLDFFLKKKYVQYYITVVICILFHRSAIILLCLPFASVISKWKLLNWSVILVPIMLYLGATGRLNSIITQFSASYYLTFNFSVLGTIIRIILFAVIAFTHHLIRTNKPENETMFYEIYKLGFYVALMLSFSDLISQRLTLYLKAIEMLLIPLQLSDVNKRRATLQIRNTTQSIESIDRIAANNRIIIYCVIMLIMNVQLYHNISGFLVQGNYYYWVRPYMYPYVSIFNKSALTNYRVY